MKASAVDREQQTFEAVPASARAARRFVSETLRDHGATDSLITDFVLIVSELATNIIEHGGGSSLVIFVDVTDPGWWEVEVVGSGSGAPDRLLQPDTWKVSCANDIAGRGLGIVRHLVDEIAADVTGDQVGIRCRKRRDES